MSVIRPIRERAEWLGWRAKDLTASDIGAVWGVDPYRTALQVWGEKTGRIEPGWESNIMRRGRWLEAATIEALKEEMPGWRFMRPGVYVSDPELRLGCTPDVFAEDPEVPEQLVNVQLKAISRPTFERDWADEQVPLNYLLQTLAEGMLLDAATNLIAALVIDTYSADLVVRDVPRHPAAEAQIRVIADSFWKMVDAGLQPAPDFARDAETIAMIHRAKPGKEIDLSADNRLRDVLEERETHRLLAKRHGEAVDTLDTEIKAKMQDAEIGLLPGWKVTWKEEQRKAYMVPASTRRPLRVTELKENAA